MIPLTDFQTIVVTVEDGVCCVVLNRPAAANSRNQVMREELCSVWSAVAEDPEIKIVILTADGDRFFCAGMDTKEAAVPETATERRERLGKGRDVELLAALPQPSIAAINGYALGGGLEMALACDLRIASDNAILGLPEVSIGLVPAGGGTQRVPRLVGPGRAAELILLGRRLTAAEASEWGLVNRTVKLGDLRPLAWEWARQLAGQPSSSLRYARELLRDSGRVPMDVGLRAELEALCDLLEQRQTS